jgi:hypothetical protein
VYVPGSVEDVNDPLAATGIEVELRRTAAPTGLTDPASVPGTAGNVRFTNVTFPGVTFPTADAGQWPTAHACTR